MPSSSAWFDELEASAADVFGDTFCARDASGEKSKATIARDGLPAFQTDYTITQHPTVLAVDQDGDDLMRLEQMTIEAPRDQFPCDSLPIRTNVEVPGLGNWRVDELLGTLFGANWVKVHLSRKPLAETTSRRMA